MKQIPPIVLASQSPRRKQLLEWAEVNFDVVVSHADESFPANIAPDEAALYVARNKALAVKAFLTGSEQNHLSGRAILAADTMVVLNGEIINKPTDRANAIHILSKLSGQEHLVITGVVILNVETEIAFADTTRVQFHPLTEEEIIFYVDKYQPYDKAGAYAIQEWIGVVGIKAINGDFYNVMGLPVSRVVQALQSGFTQSR